LRYSPGAPISTGASSVGPGATLDFAHVNELVAVNTAKMVFVNLNLFIFSPLLFLGLALKTALDCPSEFDEVRLIGK
jgi:hypothetical protein